MAESEFGKGLATCLFEFLCHAPRLLGTLRLYDTMRRKRPDLFGTAQAVELWANGASDHLYELGAPKRLGREIRDEALWIKATGLDMGHGFRNRYTEDQAQELIDRARALLVKLGDPATIEDAVQIDKGLGLRPQTGEWTCRQPLPEDM